MKLRPGTLSKSGYAARAGVGASAVSNWLKTGKLSGAALTADGKFIVVAEADRQLALNVDPGRGRPPSLANAGFTEPAPRGLRELAEETGVETLAALRIRRESLAVEKAERDAAVERGELVPADEATRAWAQELAQLVAAIELFVLDLPQKLGMGRDQTEQVRREWRQFRERQALQAEERAHAA